MRRKGFRVTAGLMAAMLMMSNMPAGTVLAEEAQALEVQDAAEETSEEAPEAAEAETSEETEEASEEAEETIEEISEETEEIPEETKEAAEEVSEETEETEEAAEETSEEEEVSEETEETEEASEETEETEEVIEEASEEEEVSEETEEISGEESLTEEFVEELRTYLAGGAAEAAALSEEDSVNFAPGEYTVPVSLSSAAPLPPVQQAFATAFGETGKLIVDEEGNKKLVVNSQQMEIVIGQPFYANVVTIGYTDADGETQWITPDSTRIGKTSKMVDNDMTKPAEVEEIEVPDQITIPLISDTDGTYKLPATVDFMDMLLGGGNPYVTTVTLTVDLAEVPAVETELEALIAEASEYDTSKYTIASADALLAAIEDAKNAEDPYRALNTLQAAIDGLEVLPEGTFIFGQGAARTELRAGTYSVPLKLKNASGDMTADDYWSKTDSMAASCIVGDGILKVDTDGSAYLTVNLGPVSFMGITASATDWKIYQSFKDYTSEQVAAEVLAEDSDGKASKIRFRIPETDRNAVYASMYIDAMNTNQNAPIAIDWKNAGDVASDETVEILNEAIEIVKTISQAENDATVQAAVATAENAVTERVTEGEAQRALTGLVDAVSAVAESYDVSRYTAVSGNALLAAIEEAKASEDPCAALNTLKTALDGLEALPEGTFVFGQGAAKTELKAGTYSVPLKLKNAKGDMTSDDYWTLADSMATSCIVGDGILKVDTDGSAYLTMNLGPVSFMGISASATDWKIYQAFEDYTNSELKAAEILAEDSDGNPTKIRFQLPETGRNAVYANMSTSGHANNAPIAIDWKNASGVASDETIEKLNDAAAAAEALNEELYTVASCEANREAIASAAEAVRKAADERVTEEAAAEALAELQSALDKLVPAASAQTNAKLNGAVELAKSIQQDKYTAASYQAVQTAIAAAENARAQRVSEEDAQKALTDLTGAVKALGIEVPTEIQPTNPSDTDKEETVSLAKVTSVKTACAGHRQVSIKWNKVANATGYKVYRYNTSAKKWNLVKTVTSNNCTIRSLTVGKTYKFKVRAYYEKDGNITYGAYSSVVSGKAVPATVSGLKAASSKNQSAKLTWKRANGVAGYVVYRSTSKNGTYKAVKTLKGVSKVTFTNTGLTAGKTYYYKVRSYNTVNGKKVYGSYSSPVKVTVSE